MFDQVHVWLSHLFYSLLIICGWGKSLISIQFPSGALLIIIKLTTHYEQPTGFHFFIFQFSICILQSGFWGGYLIIGHWAFCGSVVLYCSHPWRDLENYYCPLIPPINWWASGKSSLRDLNVPPRPVDSSGLLSPVSDVHFFILHFSLFNRIRAFRHWLLGIHRLDIRT